jgi:hypothetical protein
LKGRRAALRALRALSFLVSTRCARLRARFARFFPGVDALRASPGAFRALLSWCRVSFLVSTRCAGLRARFWGRVRAVYGFLTRRATGAHQLGRESNVSALSQAETERYLREGSGPLADLALTLPVFVVYHLGVVWLDVQNAADWVTRELKALASSNLAAYSGLTLAIGAVFVAVLLVAGRGHTLRWQRFALVLAEGVLYAVAMRLVASYVVGKVHLCGLAWQPGGSAAITSSPAAVTPTAPLGVLTAFVLSLGAGLYEEIAFRVGLYSVGRKLVLAMMPEALPGQRLLVTLGWAVSSAALFSGWHYIGQFGDPFDLRSFVFRWVCGLVFTVIYVFRGFAPAVWTHALYDIWVLAF